MESTKEKARFYDLIIGRAKKELDGCSSLNCDTANLIFKLIPELNIDEDGIMLKEIVSLIRYTKGREIGYKPRVHQDKMIAYLEKQGKQKPNQFDEGYKVGFSVAHYNQWKPTAEQMLVLNDVILNGRLPNANKKILKDLQQQLMNLKEGLVFTDRETTKPLYKIGDFIIPLNDVMCEVVDISVSATNGAIYTLKRTSSIFGDVFQVDAHTIDSTATPVQKIQKQ